MEKLPRAFVQQMEREWAPMRRLSFLLIMKKAASVCASAPAAGSRTRILSRFPGAGRDTTCRTACAWAKRTAARSRAYYCRSRPLWHRWKRWACSPACGCSICALRRAARAQLRIILPGKGVLVTNEIHPARARILLEYRERMGVTNAVVLNEKACSVAAAFGAWFDAVLVDSPRSGEWDVPPRPGRDPQWVRMRRKCAMSANWKSASAARCSRAAARMVYSTCTYNHIENEETIAAFLKRIRTLNWMNR